MAAGRRWRDRDIDQGAVIYLALEGGNGIRNRISATRERLCLPPSTPMVLMQSPVDLCCQDADVDAIIAAIRARSAQLQTKVRLLVVDTLARAMAGSDENSPEDMGSLIANSDRIRAETGVCVLYVHHSGKDAARGSRGHSSLHGANDTEIVVEGGKNTPLSVARVVRQRDLPSLGSFAFTMKPIGVGINRRGKTVCTCIVEHTGVGEDAPPPPPRPPNLTSTEKTALRTLEVALRTAPVMANVFDNDTEGLVTRESAWRQVFYEEGAPGQSPDTKQKAFKRAVEGLLAKGRIGSRYDFVWPKGEAI